MTLTPLAGLIAGAMAAGYAMVAVFFLKFWSRTRDSLFIAFATAFALLAVGQVLPVILGWPRESQPGVYLFRLGAFSLIIVAIIGKNLRGGGGAR